MRILDFDEVEGLGPRIQNAVLVIIAVWVVARQSSNVAIGLHIALSWDEKVVLPTPKSFQCTGFIAMLRT